MPEPDLWRDLEDSCPNHAIRPPAGAKCKDCGMEGPSTPEAAMPEPAAELRAAAQRLRQVESEYPEGVALALADLLDSYSAAVLEEAAEGTNVEIIYREELALARLVLEAK